MPEVSLKEMKTVEAMQSITDNTQILGYDGIANK